MVSRANIPNQLTLLRLVLAAAFFIVLNQYRYPETHLWALWVSIAIFILAALTDLLDGYLARRWQVESTFGRIMDPFCDKVLVLGAFLYLAGPRFVISTEDGLPVPFVMISGVYPWMIVVILARELLVTGIRGEMEGQGIKFGANIWGKLKATLQFIVIPIVLAIVWFDPHQYETWWWMIPVRDGLIYATVIITVISGLPYFLAAVEALRGDRQAGQSES